MNISDIYGTYKDLCLSEKDRDERLLQGMDSVNNLKYLVDGNQ